MSSSPPETRPATPADVDAVADVIRVFDIELVGRALLSAADIRVLWTSADLPTGSWLVERKGRLDAVAWVADAVAALPARPPAFVAQRDATRLQDGAGIANLAGALVSTDPPYYDNIGYADLSDFFYVWLRRSLHPIFPDLFATVAVPKAEELVATPDRHGGKKKAETFFLNGMTPDAMALFVTLRIAVAFLALVIAAGIWLQR